MACDLGPGGHDSSFDQIIYTTPVDLDKLLEMVQEDFPDIGRSRMPLHDDVLWPYNRGVLLNSFEGADRQRWQANQGTLEVYKSEWMWINGNMERVTFPEGVTEGRGSMLWQLPAHAGEAVMWGSCDLDAEMASHATHIALDALNRGTGDVELLVTVEAGAQTIAQRPYRLHEWSNQRLLLPLPHDLQAPEIQLTIKVNERAEATKLVFDNLRIFVS